MHASIFIALRLTGITGALSKDGGQGEVMRLRCHSSYSGSTTSPCPRPQVPAVVHFGLKAKKINDFLVRARIKCLFVQFINK